MRMLKLHMNGIYDERKNIMKEKWKKAKSCKYCKSVGKLGSAFVTASCKNDKKLYLKQKNIYVLIASNCESCTYYEKKAKREKNGKTQAHRK